MANFYLLPVAPSIAAGQLPLAAGARRRSPPQRVVGQEQPDSHLGRGIGKRVGRVTPEDTAQILKGLHEILAPNSVLDLALRLWYAAMCFTMEAGLLNALQVNTGR